MPDVVVFTDVPFAVVRRLNETPFAADTSMKPWTAPASDPARNITPAFAQALVFVRLATRATIEPSPFNV